MNTDKKQSLQSKISFSEKMSYGVGAIGLDMSYGLCMSFFMKYTTDVLLVSSAYLGVVMALARIWDGINDPMMGIIVSNTRSKRGRFRPWILTGAILNAVVLFFMFTNPGFSLDADKVNVGLYAYVAIVYVLWGMSYTLIDIPYWSFVPSLTSDPQERNVIASIPRFFSGVGQLTVMGATPLVLKAFSSAEQGKAYSTIALTLGLMFIVLATVTFSKTRERIVPERKESYNFKEIFRTIKENDQLIVFLVVAITYNLGWYLVNGLAAYFFEYVAENNDMFTLFAAISGAGQAIGLFGLSFLSKRIGKHNVVKLGIVVTIVGYLLMFITTMLFGFNPVIFFICDFVGCLGIGCVFTAEASMLADIVDYGEYKNGSRPDAIVFSMKSFQMKFAQTIQALIIGFGLQLCHYQENVIPQPKGAQTGILIMMFVIPPIMATVALIVFSKRYKLKPELLYKIADKMKEKQQVN